MCRAKMGHGSYLEYCEASLAEMAQLGFESQQECEAGSGTNLENGGPFELRVSSTDRDSIFYTVKIDRESYAEVTQG